MNIYFFSAIYIGTGVISFILGLKELYQWRKLYHQGMRTKGIARAISDGDDGVTLMVDFKDNLGVSHQVFSKGGDTDWASLDGKETEVLYRPGQADKARLVVDLRLRTRIGIYVFGLLYFGIGAMVLILHVLGIDVMSD